MIGGGTGGIVASLIGAGLGARVALIERERTGGDCLWTGCVPSKSLLASAGLAHRMRHADRVGLTPVTPTIDFARVMDHVQDVVQTIEPADSPARLRRAGVEVITACARFTAPGQIDADGRELRWRTAIIATGSHPALPAIPGLDALEPLTSDTVWSLRTLPARLVVLGGGPVGCELAQAFARLGSRVTLVETTDRLLGHETARASELIAIRLRDDGVDVRLGAAASETRRAPDGSGELLLQSPAGGEAVVFDRFLVATGRSPRTDGLGLAAVGVNVDERSAVRVDARLQTSARGIYAVGDVTGILAFTHVAAHHARVATPNALLHARTRVSETVPWVTFTDPEVARVGLTEEQARERWGDRVITAELDYAELDRAITAGEGYGFAQLIGDPRRRLVGATVAAPGGGEAIAELTAWLDRGARLDDISRTVHAYPTLAEGPARAADQLIADRYSTPRIRAVTRPLLAALRALPR